MLEDGLVGAEGVGVAVTVDEPAQRGQEVAACATQPLGEDPCGHAQVVPLTAAAREGRLPGETSQLTDLVAEHELDGLQEAGCVDGDGGGAPAPPDALPVVQAGGHDGEVGKVDDRARPVGVEQRRGSGGADLRVVLLGIVDGEPVAVAQGVNGGEVVLEHGGVDLVLPRGVLAHCFSSCSVPSVSTGSWRCQAGPSSGDRSMRRLGSGETSRFISGWTSRMEPATTKGASSRWGV